MNTKRYILPPESVSIQYVAEFLGISRKTAKKRLPFRVMPGTTQSYYLPRKLWMRYLDKLAKQEAE